MAGRRWSHFVVAWAAALVALHTVLDTLVFPERGTTWADHLTAVAVPLLLLAMGALVYRRLPAGGTAALMAVLGALMVVGGALALADVQSPPVRGSSVTGLLLGPVGVVLVGLAAVTAWRSRRPGRYRYLRRGLIGAACAVFAFWFVVPVALALVATHRPRQSPGLPDLGRPTRSVTVHTGDGLDLAAWYVPSRNGAAVISFPTREGRTGQARFLADHGYGVLLLDMRGYDGSEGAPNAFGWGAAKDLDAAVAWLRARPDVRDGRIGGIGFSVGAEQLLEAAARNPGLRAVVADGAGERSVRESLIRGPRGWPSLPKDFVQTAALAVLSDTAPPPSLEDLVARIAPRPILLIQAGKGGGGEDLDGAYFRAARPPKELWRIPEAGHTDGFAARPAEYERRVLGFFDEALLGPARSGRL